MSYDNIAQSTLLVGEKFPNPELLVPVNAPMFTTGQILTDTQVAAIIAEALGWKVPAGQVEPLFTDSENTIVALNPRQMADQMRKLGWYKGTSVQWTVNGLHLHEWRETSNLYKRHALVAAI